MADHEAGRDLDALIAEQVMGAKWRREPYRDSLFGANGHELARRAHDGGSVSDYMALPYYSRDIAHAWLVLEKIRASKDDEFRIAFSTEMTIYGAALWAMTGDQAAHVICLIALKAIKVPA